MFGRVAAGCLSPAAFKEVLFHVDIVMEEDSFNELIAKMTALSRFPGKVSGGAFMKL